MLAKITVLGKYTGSDPLGTWIGGKEFKPGRLLEVEVDEETYDRLKIAVGNKWFEIKTDNFDRWLIARGRHADSFAIPRQKAEVKASEVKASEVKASEVKAPEVKAPEVKASEVKAPEVKAPEVKKVEVKDVKKR